MCDLEREFLVLTTTTTTTTTAATNLLALQTSFMLQLVGNLWSGNAGPGKEVRELNESRTLIVFEHRERERLGAPFANLLMFSLA